MREVSLDVQKWWHVSASEKGTWSIMKEALFSEDEHLSSLSRSETVRPTSLSKIIPFKDPQV